MLENLLDRTVQLLWGRGTIAFTLLCGLYFTVFTHFLPLRKIGLVTQKTLGSLFCKKESKDSVSPFAAVSTALGGTMGVGNIIGVGAALALGGAGSIFWMWVGALLGMMTKYMEVFLAVRWRVRRPGSRSFCGGPMYYCARGIPHPIGKLLAVLFCIFCILSSLSSGSMVQTNAIAQSMQQSFSVSPSLCAVVLVLVCGWVLHGGCDRAVQTCSALVPWMSALYLFGCGIILFHFRQNIPSAFSQILTQAFSSGGIAGAAGSGVGSASPAASSPMRRDWAAPPSLTPAAVRTVRSNRASGEFLRCSATPSWSAPSQHFRFWQAVSRWVPPVPIRHFAA